MAGNISTDLTQFSRRMLLRSGEVEKISKDFLREVTQGIGVALVEATPMDTGQARGNWLASIGAPRGDIIRGGTSSEMEAFGRSIRPVLFLIRDDDTVYITNNLDYIADLNRGKSRQASAGFAQRAIIEGFRRGAAAYEAFSGLK